MLHHGTKYTVAIAPAAATTDNTAWTTSILDTTGFERNELIIITGSLADADATFAVTMAESADSGMSGSNAVAAADLLGTLAAAGFTYAADSSTRKVGYKGAKRYIQGTITPTGNSGNAFVAALWAQSGARVQPQS